MNGKEATRVWLTTGTVVRDYVIDARIAASGTGEVYLAKDRKSQRQVALKLLPAPPHCKTAHLEALAQQMNRQALPHHPHICETYEVGVTADSQLFIASEYVGGQSLDTLMGAGVSLDIEKIGEQIALALQAAHEAGRYHTDLKLSNVMLTPSGKVKVLDFGLAKYQQLWQAAENNHSNLNDLQPSSVRHFAPEHVNALPYTAQTDLFSLGTMLYEMLTGNAPFTGATPLKVCAAIVWEKPQPITDVVFDAAPTLCAAIGKLLEKDQAARPASAQAFLHEWRQSRAIIAHSASSRSANQQAVQGFFISAEGRMFADFGKGVWHVLFSDGANYAVLGVAALGACYALVSFLTILGVKH